MSSYLLQFLLFGVLSNFCFFYLYPFALFAVGPPLKSVHKLGVSSTTSVKVRPTSSPLPSPPEQSGLPASPFGHVNLPKSCTTVEDPMPAQVMSKENAAVSSEKEIPTRTTSAVRETQGRKSNAGAKPMDLQSMLVTLLVENPKGMSLKVGCEYEFIGYKT